VIVIDVEKLVNGASVGAGLRHHAFPRSAKVKKAAPRERKRP
jgi:hypothetical protein